MPQVYIKTFGCQMNEYDSQVMAALARKANFRQTANLNEADLVVVNTCYVREKVKHKIYSFLGGVRKLKEQKPHLLIAIGGCLVQKNADEVQTRAPFADIVFGTLNLHKLPDMIAQVRRKKNTQQFTEPLIDVREETLPHELPTVREKNFSVYVPVIRGCDNFCSYCNVPYVRGREKSRPISSVIAEIQKAAERGCREVTLLGQNVNSYGKDLSPGVDFAYLLSEVNNIEGIRRIRFTTSHPKDLSDRLISAMADLQKVCEHLHLPLQAGSDKILNLMRRSYTRQEYLELVRKVREAVPRVSITTDLMVGFPGETEQDFQDTLDMLEKVRFDGAFTFEYSALPGTRAANLPEQIPTPVKKRRLRRLIENQKAITEKKNKVWVGQDLQVLVEGTSPKDPGELQGRTRQNKMVIFSGPTLLIGKFAVVRVTRAGCWALRGRNVKSEM